MKITEIKTNFKNLRSKIIDHNIDYVEEFYKTATTAEKESKRYTEWEPKRVGQLIHAIITQYQSYSPTDQDFESNANIQLVHTIVNIIGHGQLQVELNFDGTKEMIKTEQFNFNICSSNLEELVPITNTPDTQRDVTITTEEGDEPDSVRYTSFYAQHERIGQAYHALSDNITEKNQYEYLKLIALLIIHAEIASRLGAGDLDLKISGLCRRDCTPEEAKFLDETIVSVICKSTDIPFSNIIVNHSTMLN